MTTTLTPPDKKAHFMDMKTNPIDKESIVQTLQVAHVIFYLVKDRSDEDRFFVYSASEDRGVEAVRDESIPYNDALTVLESAVQRLEEILERKRKGLPTAKQLHFLFRHHIPIPPDLTWGQAFDTIDECIAQGIQRKRKDQSEKFKGLTAGMTVYQYSNVGRGVWRTNKGEIIKLTSNNNGSVKYAYVKWDEGESNNIPASRVNIDILWKTEASKEQLRAIESKKLFPGEKVSHPSFGKGIVLHAGKTKAAVQFQDGEKTLNLTDLKLETRVEEDDK